MNRFLDSGIFLAIFTAILFALSIANFNGYLSSIGIEAGFVLRNSHQILYNSLFVILLPILQFILWGSAICVVLLAFAHLYTYILQDSYVLKKKLVLFKLKIRSYRYSRAERQVGKIVIKFIPVLTVALVIIMGLIKAENMGKEKGMELLNKIKQSKYEAHEVITIKNYKSKIYVVACGINNCGGINVDTLEVVYFENKFVIGTVSNTVNVTS